MKLHFRLVLIPLVFFVFLTQPNSTYAAGTMYLIPAVQTLTPNQPFSVDVRIATDTFVNATQINLSYPAESFDVMSISASGSAFPIGVQAKATAGSLAISRGILGDGVTGENLAVTVNFKVKPAAVGNAPIKLVEGSALVRSSDQQNILIGSPSATYTILSAGSSAQITPAGSNTQISDVRVTNISYNSATVMWKTDAPATSLVEFGLTPSYGLLAQESSLTTAHQIALPEKLLTTGATYHYRVKSSVGEQQIISADKTFFIPGVPVSVLISDSSGNILANTPVSLITTQQTFASMTSDEGIASFMNVPATNAVIQVSPRGREQFTTDIVVSAPKNGLTDKPQQFSVRVAGMEKKPGKNNLFFLISFVLLIGASVGGFFFWKWKKTHPSSPLVVPPPPKS